MKKIQIKFFSKFRDLTKTDQIQLSLEDDIIHFNQVIEKLSKIFDINLKEIIIRNNDKLNSDIIVLKNDKDFSILSKDEKLVKNNDVFVFLFTIHGG